jgi:hypothetical protein
VRFLRGFGRFWYDFIIGDDWKIAVVVVCTLAVALGAYRIGLVDETWATVLGAVLLFAGFTASSIVDVRRSG